MNCIIDLGHTGHHVEWISYFLNKEIQIFTNELNKNILDRNSPINVTYVQDDTNEEGFLKKYEEELKRYENIYFLHLDPLFSFLIKRILNPKPLNTIEKRIGGLWLRNNFFYNRHSIIGRIKFWLMITMMSLWKIRSNKFKIFFLNEQIVKNLEPLLGQGTVKFSVDPIDVDKIDQKTRQERNSILFFGSHDKRKGTDIALEELERIRYDGNIIVAGTTKHMPELDVQLDRFDEHLRIEKHLIFVEESLMHELFKKSEIIMLPYVGFGGSSGLLSWGIAYNKTIIGTNFGLIGKRLNEYQKGFPLNSMDNLEEVILRSKIDDLDKLSAAEMLEKYHQKDSFVRQFVNSD